MDNGSVVSSSSETSKGILFFEAIVHGDVFSADNCRLIPTMGMVKRGSKAYFVSAALAEVRHTHPLYRQFS